MPTFFSSNKVGGNPDYKHYINSYPNISEKAKDAPSISHIERSSIELQFQSPVKLWEKTVRKTAVAKCYAT